MYILDLKITNKTSWIFFIYLDTKNDIPGKSVMIDLEDLMALVGMYIVFLPRVCYKSPVDFYDGYCLVNMDISKYICWICKQQTLFCAQKIIYKICKDTTKLKSLPIDLCRTNKMKPCRTYLWGHAAFALSIHKSVTLHFRSVKLLFHFTIFKLHRWLLGRRILLFIGQGR